MKDDGTRRPGRGKTPANDNGAGPTGDTPRQRLDRVVLDIARLIGRQMARDDFAPPTTIAGPTTRIELAETDHDPRRPLRPLFRRQAEQGIPGPLGRAWGDTSIRGHVTRGTGILNNELYTGVLVWNRQQFVKDPSTGKRVSRPNPESARIRTEVPHLKIVDDALWQAVRARQQKISVLSGPKTRPTRGRGGPMPRR